MIKTSKKSLKKSTVWCIATRPMHPRYKLKRKLKKRKDELQFTKQIPMLRRDSLERIVKKGKMN